MFPGKRQYSRGDEKPYWRHDCGWRGVTEPPPPVKGPSGSAGDTEIKPGFVHSLFFEGETLNFLCWAAIRLFFFRREGKRKRIDREGMVLGSLHLTDLSFFDKLVKLLIFGTVGCESNYTDKMRNYWVDRLRKNCHDIILHCFHLPSGFWIAS